MEVFLFLQDHALQIRVPGQLPESLDEKRGYDGCSPLKHPALYIVSGRCGLRIGSRQG